MHINLLFPQNHVTMVIVTRNPSFEKINMDLQQLKSKKLHGEPLRILSFKHWRRRVLFWVGGLFVGLMCVSFAVLCDFMNDHFILLAEKHPYWPLIITPLGFMLIVLVMRWSCPGAQGSGIPQVIAALQLNSAKSRERLVSLRIAIGKYFLTIAGFMCGASIGREGPTIQLSASVMHALRRWGAFHRHDAEKGLLLAGGAAGIAAAFNAPLAGIVFAIEELSGSFEKGLSGTIITTVVLCGIVAQAILGNYVYFGRSGASLNVLYGGWLPILVCAVVCGALGGLFSWLLVQVSFFMRRMSFRHPIWIAGGIGLIVAIVGILSHGLTYGSGYIAAKSIITHSSDVVVPEYYGPLKMIVTLLTYLSGIPGGIFAPSLSAGAGFGHLLGHFFSGQFADAVILLGTVAYFSGVVQSPITCFVIVLEMTASASGNMVLPIMMTSLIATAVSKLICRDPLYHALSLRYIDTVKQQKRQLPVHD